MALGDITNTSRSHRSQPPRTTDTFSSDTTSTTEMRPLNFLIALYPGFQLMDLAGPLDILNIVSLPPFSQPLRLTFLASTLDPVPTKPVPPKGANYHYDLSSVMGVANVNTTFQQYLHPQDTFSNYLSSLASNAIPESEKPDILFLPGGLGSRMHRLTPISTPSDPHNTTSTLNVQDLIDWIPTISPHLRTGIMTVCTGSDILARTGVLSNRRATTNMMRFQDVATRHPGVQWVKGARWVVSRAGDGQGANSAGETDGSTAPNHENENEDKNKLKSASNAGPASNLEIWSSAGISAGMDVTLAFVAEYYGGTEVSRDIARRLEYDWGETQEGEVHKMYKRYFDV